MSHHLNTTPDPVTHHLQAIAIDAGADWTSALVIGHRTAKELHDLDDLLTDERSTESVATVLAARAAHRARAERIMVDVFGVRP